MEIEEVRRHRLRLWIDSDPASMGDAQKWCTHYSQFVEADESPLNPTYIRQLAPKKGKATRNIGERTARRLERIGKKPKGWLDQAEGDSEPAVPAEQQEPSDAQGSTGNVITFDVVQHAIIGVLHAFGLRYEDLVADEQEARLRVERALQFADQDAHITRLRLHIGKPGDSLLPARATRSYYTKRFSAEVPPDLATEGEEDAEKLQERRV